MPARVTATAANGIREIDHMAKLLSMKAVSGRVGYSESKLYSMIREGEFPPGRKLATGGVRWLESDVDDWIMRAYAEAPEARLRLA